VVVVTTIDIEHPPQRNPPPRQTEPEPMRSPSSQLSSMKPDDRRLIRHRMVDKVLFRHREITSSGSRGPYPQRP